MMPQPPAADSDRNPVDVLADEFALRYRRGETPSITEYVRRYPEHAEQIESLFPSVALLEQLGSRPEGDGEGRPAPQGSLPPHHQVGDFEILRVIGRGGMGVVYEAVQQSLHRTVALKVLSTSSLHSENQVKRFEREAQAAAQLHHTNIVPVFGVGEQEGLRYYVMQRIHGLGLDAVLAELARCARSGSPTVDRSPGGPRELGFAHDLAGVLISGELTRSKSGSHLSGDTSSTRSHPSAPSVGPMRSGQGSAVDGSAETRLFAPTPSSGDTSDVAPPSFVPSSLVLRDSFSGGAGVRSSMILRDDLRWSEEASLGDRSAVPSSNESVETGGAAHFFGRRYWRNIARIGVQVASGLQYAHSQSTLHRDIKPANILLDNEGTAWIADFGLAKVLESDNVTRTGDVVGTLRYMAPEQFHGEAHARSDLYSLGLTLYELLTLRPAYDETDRQKLIARKLTPHDPPSLRKWAPDIPRDLETIVHKCLAYEAGERYATAGAVLEDLQAFLDDRPIQARQSSPVERLWRWCRRNPAIAGLSGTVALLLLLTLGLTSAGYVQEKQRAALEQQRASDEQKLRADAQRAEQHAVEERVKAESIVEIVFKALNGIGQSFVSDDMTGTINLDDDSADEQIQAPAFSPETAAIMELLRNTFDELAEIAGENSRFLDYATSADLRAGELHLRLNQWEQAKAAFLRAIQLYEKSGQSPADADAVVRLAKLYNGLGVAYESLGEWEPKRDVQERALALLREAGQGPEIQFELARTHYLIGRRPSGPPTGNARRRGRDRRDPPPPDGERPRPIDARFWERLDQERREHLADATTQFADLATKHPSVSQYQYWLALCHLEAAKQSVRSPEAEERKTQAIAILEQLVHHDAGRTDYLYHLSEAYELSYDQYGPSLGPRPWWDHDEPQAGWSPASATQVEGDLRLALRYSNELIERQPHVPGYAMSNLILMMRLMDVLHAQGNEPAALELLDRIDASRSTVEHRFPELETFSQFFGTAAGFMRARVYVAHGRFAEARDILAPMVAGFSRFEGPAPGGGRPPRGLPREILPVYRLLVTCLERLGENEQATTIRSRLEAINRSDAPPDRGSPPRPRRPD
ncbi:MAG: protein kinase [Planctomycetaceae bacterium]|nr:protein kinase [Planctomycetaceae bacterium]